MKILKNLSPTQQKMDEKNENVLVIFKNKIDLETAIDALVDRGFRGDEIAVFTSNQGTLLDNKQERKLGEGLLIGTLSGIILGALLCWLMDINLFTGEEAGSMSRLWSVVACSMIGAMIGSVVGGMIGLMIPEFKVKHFETLLPEGSILVNIDASNNEKADIAKAVLESYGGSNVNFSQVRRVS